MVSVDFTPFITIGMPVKNRAQYISRVLAGIENLDYPKTKIKLVFVDAFSADGTYEVLVNWKERVKKNFFEIVLIQKETNIPQARNICINNSHGDYILFWDSDVLPPNSLLKQMINIANLDKGIGIIGADYYYIFNNFFTKIIGQPILDKEASYAFMGFTLIRNQVFSKIAPFNESFSIGEDSELVMRLIKETDYRTMWAPKPVLHLKAPIPFRKIIKWCLLTGFHERGAEIAKSFSSIPLFSKLRLVYYGLLPIILTLLPTISYFTVNIWGILLAVVYLLIGMVTAIKNSNMRKGIVVFIIYLPVNIAISYGALAYSIKSFLLN